MTAKMTEDWRLKILTSSGSLTEIANHNKDLFIYLFILNIIDRITLAQFQFNTTQTQFKLMQSLVICWYPLL